MSPDAPGDRERANRADRAAGETLSIEVAYAERDRQTLIGLDVPAGATVADALARSRIFERHPALDATHAPVGIFGKAVARDRILQNGDRIEIYRPLVADPKASRHARVAKKRALVDSVRNMRA
jgi:putative ubiquitin-RnfH superfamily antitoxin RatB of RatAB toxin-antitoxin module